MRHAIVEESIDVAPECSWQGHGEQRFWMEIARVKEPGIDLRAPITSPGEKPVWHWDLVRLVQPGDVIVHWFTTPAGATGIVGWSRAASAVVVESHVWVPRTRTDIDPSTAERRPHWIVPLKDYTPLPMAIARDHVETIHSEVLRLEDDLKARHPGFKYYPFQDYRPTEMRGRQAYLTKISIELLLLLNRIGRFGFEVKYEAHRAPRVDQTDLTTPAMRAATASGSARTSCSQMRRGRQPWASRILSVSTSRS